MDLSFFDVLPVLEAQRLLLRELQPQDAAAHFEIFSNAEVTRCYWKAVIMTCAGSPF